MRDYTAALELELKLAHQTFRDLGYSWRADEMRTAVEACREAVGLEPLGADWWDEIDELRRREACST